MKFKWSLQYVNLTIASCTYIVFYLCRQNLSAVSPLIIEDVGLTNTELGLIMSCFFISYALSQLPFGYLADRIGPQKVICLGGVLIGVANIFFGCGSTLLHFVVAQLINGWGQGTGWSPSIKLITDWFKGWKREIALGIFMTATPIGMFVSYVLSGWLGFYFGWRTAFMVPALMMLCFTIIFGFGLRNVPKKDRREQIVSVKTALFSVASNSILLKIGLVYSCILFSNWGIVMWLPTYVVKTMNFDVQAAGWFSGITTLSSIIAKVVAGVVLHKIFHGNKKALISTCLILSAFVIYLVPHFRNFNLIVGLLSLTYFLLQLPFPIIFAYPAEVLPKDLTGTGTALINTLGQFAPVISMILTGFLLDLFRRYDFVFVMFSTSSIIGGVATFLLIDKTLHTA